MLSIIHTIMYGFSFGIASGGFRKIPSSLIIFHLSNNSLNPIDIIN